MASCEEGHVIAPQSVEQWNQHFQRGVASNKLVVVDFTASWCGPCRFIAPIFAELAKKHSNAMFLKVDVDELKSVAEKYNVEAMPTFVFLKDGEEIDRVVGARKDDLVSGIAKHCTATVTATA